MSSSILFKFNNFRKFNSVLDIVSKQYLPGKTFIRNYPAPKKRFYKNVSITTNNGQYEINLDRRKLKTPMGNLFLAPNEPLAILTATEWDSQQEFINSYDLHITNLCNTVLDNPSNTSREDKVKAILDYLESDTICYRVEEPKEVIALQHQQWDPIILWFQERYNVELNISSSLSTTVISEQTIESLKKHFLSYNSWSLQGLLYVVENLKSVILALATIDRFIDVEKSVYLSRLELEYQISCWGKVDWAHDSDLLELRGRTAAGVLFTHLNSESTKFKHKKINLI